MGRRFSLYSMALLYFLAGINHFINPRFYTKIMPPFLPYHNFLVLISGVFEVVFALLLLPAKTRRAGALLIVLLLIFVFPANIQMAVDFYRREDRHLWAALLRLPLQFVLIWWALTFAKKQPDVF